jgi:hypothetical protein
MCCSSSSSKRLIAPSTSLASHTSLDSYLEQRQKIKRYQSFDKNKFELQKQCSAGNGGDYDDIIDNNKQHEQQLLENQHQQQTNQAAGSRGVHGWNSLRAVMAYYCSLRKIKRNGYEFC